MIPLRLYVENIAGDWFGWIEDFPGAYAPGATTREVERSAPRAFADYLNWLRSHGEPVPDDLRGVTSADFTSQVAQTIAGSVDSPADASHFMEADRRALRSHEFHQILRLLRCSRSDLVDAAGAIPPYEWDTAPPGARSIRAFLQRLADAETSMLGRIGVKPTFRPNPDPLTTLARTRAMFEAAVTAVFDEGSTGTVECDASNWSLPKVLRLAVWHERHTADQIAARLNPTMFMRSVRRQEAVIRNRDVTDRSGDAATAVEDQSPAARHTHASAYYY